ncbi:MAG: WYL domain-containing transcriptional regulator [Planctomycetota bacterium]|nr:WYL domain-containing transcriptional regulator [Planctomycetota bacterium]
MARNEQLIRQHKLLQVLERTRFGSTLNELRDSLVDDLGLNSLHTRTLRRDVEALQAAGIDIITEELDRGKVWKLGPQANKAYAITATATELVALSMGREMLAPLSGTFIGQGIHSFWNRVEEVVPPSVWQHYQRCRETLFITGTPAKNYNSHQGILKTLERCVIQRRWCAIEYESLQQSKRSRIIAPRAIVFYHSSLYVIADESSHPEMPRHWKLDRISSADMSDEYFAASEEDYHDYLESGIGIFANQGVTRYVIRLNATAAKWVAEEPWHLQQELAVQEDGSTLLRVPAHHDMEVIPRLLGLCANAELLEPLSCRRAVAQLLNDMTGVYENG